MRIALITVGEAAGDAAYTASGQFRGAYSSVAASASTGSGYSQESVGATGALVVHRGGVTLANQMTDPGRIASTQQVFSLELGRIHP